MNSKRHKRPNMPVYEYRCSCMHEFEVCQEFSDKALIDCPVCGQPNLERLISKTIGIVSREATTLGQLAERNSKRDRGKQQDITDLKKIENIEARKEMKKLGRMTEEQKQKYIEGE